MHGHDVDHVAVGVLVALGDQRHMLEKALQILELLQAIDQLLQALKPARRVG
ncbi:hypothetical protein D3C83_210710 [compost metagenome]